MWVVIVILGFTLPLVNIMGKSAIYVVIAGIIGLFVFAYKYSEDSLKIRKDKHVAIMSKKIEGFSPTKDIYRDFSNIAVYIDEFHKKIMIANLTTDNKAIYFFDELIECSILEDGATIQSGGVGRSVAGGIIGGGVGAIVGATTRSSKPVTLSLSVRIITSNIQDSLHAIPIITTETKRNSDDYKQRMEFAQEIYATMISVINSAKMNQYARSMRRPI